MNTTYGFGRATNPVLVAITTELDRRKVRQGPAFVNRPARTRAERLREGQGPMREHRRSWIGGWIRFHLWSVADVVYRGRLA